jgi:glycosyltransferase involved in cell wall biosynthesis
MGHATFDASLVPVLAGMPDVEARFAGLREQTRVERALWRAVPRLAELDLDMQPTRWHAVHSYVARRVLSEELARFDADVVHVRSHSIALAMPEGLNGVPLVPVVDATVWDWRLLGSSRPPRRHTRAMMKPSELAERRLFRRAPLVLAMNRWAQASIERAVPEAHVVEHHPGVDLERFKPAERQGSQALRVLFVGGRFARKGGPELIEALGERLGRDVELDAVTAEPVPEREGIRTHSLTNDDPRLVELYQQADVFCLPTTSDAVPWAVIEAMACGAPVVSTDVAAIPELVAVGAAGVLVKPGDREGLRRELWALLDDEARRRELSERARSHVEERYDARKRVPELIELLRGVAGRR